jgi:hypothetical protein
MAGYIVERGTHPHPRPLSRGAGEGRFIADVVFRVGAGPRACTSPRLFQRPPPPLPLPNAAQLRGRPHTGQDELLEDCVHLLWGVRTLFSDLMEPSYTRL